MMNRRQVLGVALAGAAPLAWAQADYPNRPIRIIVPFGAGALTGTFAQIVGEGLKERLGQAVVVDYKPGATGNIGADLVAKSPPDGYNMVVTTNATFAINPFIYTKMPFDPLKDFDQLLTGITYGTILVVPPDSPFKSVADIVAYGKANPGKLTQASSGTGSTAQLAGELFARSAGFHMLHIPYKGGPPARMDVMAGRVSMMFTDPSGVPLIKEGKLRALAVSSARRSKALPDVPTLAEQGYPDVVVETWFGLALPANTPRPIAHKLETEISAFLQRKETRERFLALGAEVPDDTSSAGAVRRIVAEQKMWAPIIKDLRISVD
jgi:tripartite-type tricarboxylate transporter receptor subunit TctC